MVRASPRGTPQRVTSHYESDRRALGDVGDGTFIVLPPGGPGEPMADRVTVATTDDLAPGEGMAVSIDRDDGDDRVGIALFNIGGEFHAIANRCTHAGGSLGNGRLEGSTVTCPLHGAKFDVTTGDVLRPPADQSVRRYDVEVEDGEVRVVL